MSEKFIVDNNSDNFDVDILNVKEWLEAKHNISKDDIESIEAHPCRVEWDFNLECRSWGVKSIVCYATEVSLTLLVEVRQDDPNNPNDDIYVEKYIDVDLTEFELDTETSSDFTGQFNVDNVMIDFGQKDITVHVNRQ